MFDLGGVVIDLDRDRCVEQYKKLGFADISSDLDQYVQSGIFYELETGKITTAGFYDFCLRQCAPGTSTVQIQDAFNAFLVELPVERLRKIREIRNRFQTFALSNTNPVMYDSWIAQKFRQEGLTINDYFDGIVTSFQEGTCKPDTTIFQRLLERNSLNPARTLFLDDSEANCQAARECGIMAERITSDNNMISVISRLTDDRQ